MALQREQEREREREARWDNLRYVAGTGVVLIHITETLPEPDGLHWLYLATWAMRIPLFALLAGYFSSASPLTRGRAWGLAVMLLLPYFTVQLVAWLEIQAMAGAEAYWTQEVHNPGWTLWFLQALILWRLALPYLVRLRYPLAATVVAALVAGYLPIDPMPFAFSRAVVFLPFFLLGWKLRRGDLDGWLRARWSRGPALAVLAVAFTAAWFGRDHVGRDVLEFRLTYAELGMPFDAPLAFAWLIRCAVLLGGMAVALSVVRLAPRRHLPVITYLGSGGLYIYLLHGLLLRPLNAAEAFAWVDSWTDQAAVVGFAVGASAVLASPPVRALTWPIVQPRLAGRLSADRPTRPDRPDRRDPEPPPRARGLVRVPLGRGRGA
ncbi:acyltransferase family protein [Streptomyces sp. 6N223]|uniref:acyltransferase family protein n=1 Tax=Streptomyces sp. 6N223 TaxID=3457412 RepID=UPI003FD55C23